MDQAAHGHVDHHVAFRGTGEQRRDPPIVRLVWRQHWVREAGGGQYDHPGTDLLGRRDRRIHVILLLPLFADDGNSLVGGQLAQAILLHEKLVQSAGHCSYSLELES